MPWQRPGALELGCWLSALLTAQPKAVSSFESLCPFILVQPGYGAPQPGYGPPVSGWGHGKDS